MKNSVIYQVFFYVKKSQHVLVSTLVDKDNEKSYTKIRKK